MLNILKHCKGPAWTCSFQETHYLKWNKVSIYPKNKYYSSTVTALGIKITTNILHECRISSSKETKSQEALIKGTVIEMGSQESIAHNKSLFFQSDLHIIAA